MKKVLSIVLTVSMMAALLSGCGSGSSETSGGDSSSGVKAVTTESIYKPTNDASKWKIAVVIKDSSNGWFVRMEQGVKQFASDYGINAFQKGPASTDAAQQVEVIQNVINQNIDALCVVPVDPAACENVLKEAREKGILVITHEGSTCQNSDIDLEAFSNAGYGAYIMDNLAAAMGEEGTYVTMVAHLTNASQNEWADGAVAQADAKYPKLKLQAGCERVESENDSEKAYEVAKEVLKKYPDVKGFVGTSSMDTPGIARAIDELGLKGKVFVAGTGMPNECRELLKDGSIAAATLWDPAEAGYAMCVMATMMLDGQQLGAGSNLGLASYKALVQNADNSKVVEGAGWISLNGDNVDNFDF